MRLGSLFIYFTIFLIAFYNVCTVTVAENDFTLKVGHYAEYIARYVRHDEDMPNGTHFLNIYFLDNPRHLIDVWGIEFRFRWEIIDENESYYTVRVSITVLNATFLELQGLYFNREYVGCWNFSQTYFVNKEDRKTYFADNHTFCSYWPYWITHEEISNPELLKDRYVPPSHFSVDERYYILTDKKLLLGEGDASPPLIVFEVYLTEDTKMWEKGTSVMKYFYEPTYGLCLAMGGEYSFPLGVFRNNTVYLWITPFDRSTFLQYIHNMSKYTFDAYYVPLYKTNVPWERPPIEAPSLWRPSIAVIVFAVVSSSVLVSYEIIRRKR